MNVHLDSLLQQEVSRQEFLGMIGLAVGSILGFGTIIRLLTGQSLGTQQSHTGYSNSVFGGGKEVPRSVVAH